MLPKLRHSVLAVLTIGSFACATTAQTTRKPIYEQAKQVTKLPDKIEKKTWPAGTIVSVEKDQKVPFSGILFTEPRATEMARLRIGYEELYAIAKINEKFMEVVLKTADKSLEDADQEIKRLRESQNSWWNRNKLAIGITLGFLFGAALTGGVFYGVSRALK